MLDLLAVSSMGLVASFGAYQKISNKDDARIIQMTAKALGLYINDGDKKYFMKLKRKEKSVLVDEYIYQLPMGLSVERFEKNLLTLEQALNSQRTVIDKLRRKKKKEKWLELSFDGMLHVKVHKQTIPSYIKRNEITAGENWSIPLGNNKSTTIHHDFDTSSHVLIAGSTGGGKSTLMEHITLSLLEQNAEHTKLLFIDMKGGISFVHYRDIKQCKGFAYSLSDALEVLKVAQGVVNVNLEKLFRAKKRHIKELGIKERYFLVIDEGADLSPSSYTNKEEKALADQCNKTMEDIARRGRAAGVFLLFATQYPTAKILSSQIKQNMTTKISFRLENDEASNVIFDQPGAEKLPQIPGRCLARVNGVLEQIQTPNVTESEVLALVNENLGGERYEVDIKTPAPSERNMFYVKQTKIRDDDSNTSNTRPKKRA